MLSPVVPSPQHSNLRPLSIYTQATATELLKTLTYIAIFFLVINNLYKREQIKRILIVIVALGFAVSVFAFVQKFSGAGKIYWFQQLTKGGSLYGPYVNRNHLAGYITMIIPLAFGLFALNISRFYTSVTRKMPLLLTSIVFLYILIVMIIALVFSLSRGGMISFALSTVLMLGLYLVSQRYRLKFAVIPLIVGLLAYLLTILSKWGKRHDPFIKGLTICALAGIFAMLLHSLVDFNLHIPANAMFFFLLLGLTYSLVHCEGRTSASRRRKTTPNQNLSPQLDTTGGDKSL